MPDWHDRGRERQLFRFYWGWAKSPFVQFRHRWETVTFWVTVLLVPIAKQWSTTRNLPFNLDELAWQIPLAFVAVVAITRAVLYPANQRLESEAAVTALRDECATVLKAAVADRDEKHSAKETAHLARQREIESHIEKLEERRPRIRIHYLYKSNILGNVEQSSVQVRNAGEIEAKRVHIRPLRIGKARAIFRPVDVVGTTLHQNARDVHVSFRGLDDLARISLAQFLVEAYFDEAKYIAENEMPPIDEQTPGTPETDRVIRRAVEFFAGAVDNATVDLRAIYYDDYDRRYASRHRIRFRIFEKKLVAAAVDLVSDGEPSALPRSGASSARA